MNRRGLSGLGGALLQTRLGVLEARLLALAGAARGCATCAAWPSMAITYPEETAHLRDGPPDWPESLRCPRCGREPADVVRVVYVDVPGPIDLLPAQEWRGRTS